MALAVEVLKAPSEDNTRDAMTSGLPGFNDAAARALARLEATAAPLDPTGAAHALALSGMRLFTQLLQLWGASAAAPGAGKAPGAVRPADAASAAADVLRALAPRAQALPAGDGAGGGGAAALVQQLAPLAFDAAKGLSCLAAGYQSLELEVARVELQAAIVAAAAAHAPPSGSAAAAAAAAAPAHAKMRRRLARAAQAQLKEGVGAGGAAADEAAEDGAAFSWRACKSEIAALVALWVGHSPEPTAALSDIAALLAAVPGGKVPAKEADGAIEGYPSLTVNTFPHWYRVAFEQLVAQTEALVARALGLLASPAAAAPEAGGAGGGGAAAPRGRGGKKAAAAAALALSDSVGDADVDAAIAGLQAAAGAFGGLVQLSKLHPTRAALLGHALKLGARFVEAATRGAPFWRAAYAERGGALVAYFKALQRGTRLIQVCEPLWRGAAGKGSSLHTTSRLPPAHHPPPPCPRAVLKPSSSLTKPPPPFSNAFRRSASSPRRAAPPRCCPRRPPRSARSSALCSRRARSSPSWGSPPRSRSPT